MALETGDYINDLVVTNPPGTDPKSQGDDHLRLIKDTLQNSLGGFAGAIVRSGTDGGIVNAYTVTTTIPVVAYTERMIVLFSPTVLSTGACTLNVSGLGVKDLKDTNGNALISGDLVVGAVYAAMYINGEFRLTSLTENYVTQLALTAGLPAIAGNDRKYLRAISGSAIWDYVGIKEVSSATSVNFMPIDNSNRYVFTGVAVNTVSSTIVADWWISVKNDFSSTVEIESIAVNNVTSTTSNSVSSGTTWTISTGLTISVGDLVTVRRTSSRTTHIVGVVASYDSGTGVLVITRNYSSGSGTFTDWTITTRPSNKGIDGLATLNVYPGEERIIRYNGTAFTTTVVKPFKFIPSVSTSFFCPTGYSAIEVDLVGGGGGGSAGTTAGPGSLTRRGGSPGGAPSRVLKKLYNILVPGTRYSVLLGAGGSGGTVANGTAGGNTEITSIITAYGGAAGVAIVGTGSLSGTSGSGSGGAGVSSATSGVGGLPSGSYFGGLGTAANDIKANNIGFGGGGVGNQGIGGGCSEWGGSGGEALSSFGIPLGGSSLYGVSAAGNGGWINDSNAVPANAGRAGKNGTYTAGGGALGGVCGASPTAGANGANATSEDMCGESGGGGGSSITAAAAKGGNGGFPGGAGGGGGSSTTGFSAGGGGDGAAGRAILRGVI